MTREDERSDTQLGGPLLIAAARYLDQRALSVTHADVTSTRVL